MSKMLAAGLRTVSTNPGSLSNTRNAFDGQSAVQLVYGLGTLKLSARTSCGTKATATNADIAPTRVRSGAS